MKFINIRELSTGTSLILRHVLFPVLLFLTGVLVTVKLSSKPKTKVESKKKVIREIGEEYHRYSDQFGDMCPA